MTTLAILQHDATSRARVRQGLSRTWELEFVDDWPALWDLLSTPPVAGCLVDIHDPFHPVSMHELLRLRRLRPPVAIVVYSDFTGREMDLFDLGRHEIDGVVLAGTGDSPRVLRETMRHALGTAVASRVAWTLAGRLPPLALETLRWSVENAHRAPGVDELAAAVGERPRALARELRRHDLPSPRRILLWGRLFRAAHMLETGDRSVESVAFAVGYASGTSLARAFRRGTGEPPSEVMRKGGVAWVLEAFHRARRSSRGPVRTRRIGVPRWARGR